MAKKETPKAPKVDKDYAAIVNKLGMNPYDGVDCTHDGYPMTAAEAKFVDLVIVYGNIQKAIKESGVSARQIANKDYITDEISWRLEQMKKETIADADEVMQYFTRVMRGQEKDQFGLDAPLSERTAAAREIAKRTVDLENATQPTEAPEIKITLNWGD